VVLGNSDAGREEPEGAAKAAFPNQAILSAILRTIRVCRCGKPLLTVPGGRTRRFIDKGKSENYAVPFEGSFRVFRLLGLRSGGAGHELPVSNNRTQFDRLYRSRFRTILVQG
jgi:hypothetical protein